MNQILQYFEKISSIPHCSFDTKLLAEEIISFAKAQGFKVFVDDAKNILCKKGNPKICLQAHYDMVCIGSAPNIELVQKKNILKAKNSTLGADNGMGMAIMFDAMCKFNDIECLFTNDEEVGLIGASKLDLELSSDKLLNLDGEEAKEIYIGCAGGVDIVSSFNLEFIDANKYNYTYKTILKDLPGGHSGVDIDKEIPSAIKVLAQELSLHDIKLCSFEGGEMRNSIPKKAVATFVAKDKISLKNREIVLEELREKKKYIKNSDTIIKLFHSFAQGVRSFDKKMNIPSVSINLGKVEFSEERLSTFCSVRAMNDSDLDKLASETVSFFELAGFKSEKKDFHGAWRPEEGEFALLVKKIMQKTYEDVELKAIHAGLECGMIIKKQLKKVEAISIGPTIRFPHSLNEECDLDSVEEISIIVEEIIKKV